MRRPKASQRKLGPIDRGTASACRPRCLPIDGIHPVTWLCASSSACWRASPWPRSRQRHRLSASTADPIDEADADPARSRAPAHRRSGCRTLPGVPQVGAALDRGGPTAGGPTRPQRPGRRRRPRCIPKSLQISTIDAWPQERGFVSLLLHLFDDIRLIIDVITILYYVQLLSSRGH